MKNTNISGDVGSPEELADLIDSLMNAGTGHINVNNQGEGGLTVNTVRSTDFCGTKGACQQPTEYFDDEED